MFHFVSTGLALKQLQDSYIVHWLNKQQEGNADPTLKPDFYIFLLMYQHITKTNKMNVSLPFEGDNVAYQCKGLEQSNIVCENEVNLSTNEKVITEKQTFNTNS